MTRAWTRCGSDEVTQVGWRTITRKHFVSAHGVKHDFDTIGKVGDQVAAVVALTNDNQVVVAEQFRTGPERIMVEMPGGIVDPGETPIQAAARELLEETGYQAGGLELLGVACDDAYSNIERHFFLARSCVKVQAPQLEDAEEIEVKLISIEELFHNARTNRMSDALAVYYASDELKSLL